MLIVYYSTESGNTRAFVNRLKLPTECIPISPKCDMLRVHSPFVLICPTYADGDGVGAVPKQVIRFLNIPEHRPLLRAVIAGGNRNFGAFYGYAGDVISKKCNVPCLYKFELRGTSEDIENVERIVREL